MAPDQRAFTLIEIIVVATIIMVIAAFALPKLFGVTERVRAKEAEQILISILAAQKRHRLEQGSYADDIADLDVTIPEMRFWSGIGAISDLHSLGYVVSEDCRLEIDSSGIIRAQIAGTCVKYGY